MTFRSVYPNQRNGRQALNRSCDQSLAMPLDTEELSERFRAEAIDLKSQRLLITNFIGTEQEHDFAEPANCDGFGRIRHFRRETSAGWPENPLPVDPACRALGIPLTNVLRAQAFQNAVCNWRCWYCFVPFDLLRANKKHSAWLSANDLIDLYLKQDVPPKMIDLTGGQPDLTPEWIPWMMKALRERGLDKQVYLWSDDNLSNDFFWRFLSPSEIELVSGYPKYGRVACFKGFDRESFAFNTKAAPELFPVQFELLRRFLDLGVDLYCYVTLTTANGSAIKDKICRFMDQLQELDENLPLRVVPLEIKIFTPVTSRLKILGTDPLNHQWKAIEAWNHEINDRFDQKLRGLRICDVSLRNRQRIVEHA
jgi:uncharacterized Fe-S cluster-containing radical SAM superfamily protein